MIKLTLQLLCVFFLTFIGISNGFVAAVCILIALVLGFYAGASKGDEQ